MTGLRCNFIRFSGCNLTCPWCDTDHSQFKEMTIPQIIREIDKSLKWVILTGGEPTIQDTNPLISALQELNIKIGIETNGLNQLPAGIDWVSMSPKKGYLNIDNLKNADEIKIVVADDKFDLLIAEVIGTVSVPVWLQPEGNKRQNIIRCMTLSKIYKCRIGHQMHKIRGWK